MSLSWLPLDPGQQALDVLLLQSAAAPDAKARRGVAIAVEIVSDRPFFEHLDDLLGHRGLIVSRKAIVPVAGELHAHTGVGAHGGIGDHVLQPRSGFDPVLHDLGVGVGAFDPPPCCATFP